jgi:hypothetical protein
MQIMFSPYTRSFIEKNANCIVHTPHIETSRGKEN